MQYLGVKDLVSKAAWLFQNLSAVPGIGIISEIGPFIDKALTAGINADAKGLAVLLEGIAPRQVTKLRGIAIPADCMAAGPVPRRGRARGQCHANALSGVVTASPDPGQVPARTEIPRAPFRVGFETARSKDSSLCPDGEGTLTLSYQCPRIGTSRLP